MSNGLRSALNLLQRMSAEAEVPMDKIAKVLALEWNQQAEEQAQRRSSPEEKDVIETKLQELFDNNPRCFDEHSPKEIAKNIGVRVNQGNRSRIRHKVKQLLLTYTPEEPAKPVKAA
jgi:hypothetical protein